MHVIPLNIPESSLSNRLTISTPTTGNGRFLHQGAELYGIITLRLEPYAGPAPFLLVWQVTEEQIPEEFLPGVVEGLRQVVQQERAEGGWLTHIKVIVVDGRFHPVDSRSLAFTKATLLAFEEALTRTSIIPFIEPLIKPEDLTT